MRPMQFTPQHDDLRRTAARFVRDEIEPHVDAWEAAEEFPSHHVFKKLGDLGLLGVKYEEAYGVL
jgi:Acyl-CoA dehydrogenases